jgi:hypothetical protein
MTQRTAGSLVAVLIRIGLLLALAIMLMVEDSWAQWRPHKALTPVRPTATATRGSPQS